LILKSFFDILFWGDYMNDWISVKEAAKIKNCTTANINYYIKQGKLEARKEKGRWLINPESINIEKETSRPSQDFDSVFGVLKVQLEEKDKQIALLQEQLGQSQQLLAMEKQEKLQLLADNRPWYRRWRKEKAT
jgi:helix-turn-helix protein